MNNADAQTENGQVENTTQELEQEDQSMEHQEEENVEVVREYTQKELESWFWKEKNGNRIPFMKMDEDYLRTVALLNLQFLGESARTARQHIRNVDFRKTMNERIVAVMEERGISIYDDVSLNEALNMSYEGHLIYEDHYRNDDDSKSEE